MKKLSVLFSISLAASGLSPATAADAGASVLACSKVADAQGRLGCYDKVAADLKKSTAAAPSSTAAAPATYQPIKLIDLKTDIKSMRGQRIVVSGLVAIVGDMVFLKSEPFDTNSVSVAHSKLSREERKALLEHCTDDCDATIYGIVGTNALGAVLIAERLTVKK